MNEQTIQRNPQLPIETLFEREWGKPLPLTPALREVCGTVTFPDAVEQPSIIGNFVSTLDGVATLNISGHASGGDISGFNWYDQVMVGLLRAAADAVIIGAGTMRVEKGRLLTPESIAPAHADEYRRLRAALGKPAELLNVIVTARGDLDFAYQFTPNNPPPLLIITTTTGLRQLSNTPGSSSLQIVAVQEQGMITAQNIVDALQRVCPGQRFLLEGGPRLMSQFVAERIIDELFLTIAPQIAGRDDSLDRPGIVTGHLFAPAQPRWSKLISVKRGGDHLFLRYELEKSRSPVNSK